jgi:transglutaminase-like putative cysteine protease
MKRLFRHACAMLAVLLVMSMFTVVNASAPYLIATTDVQFTSGDDVCKKAAELCKDAKTDMDKVTAIYNYIAGHDTYDTKLANDITSGKVSKYIPDTAATLNSNKGICYDLASLFAAMCRSQDIPCTLTKGCAGSSYHAWNKVNVSGNWYQIDMTYAVTKRVINETTFAGCVSPPDLHPAKRHARRVRGGVNPHNSSKDGGRYSLPPSFLRGIRSVNILYIFENRLAFLGKSGILRT